MPCRVGITTRPQERKEEWAAKVVGMRNWQLAGPYRTREEAQAAENFLAKQYGCDASGGGREASRPWHIYRFDYTRKIGI